MNFSFSLFLQKRNSLEKENSKKCRGQNNKKANDFDVGLSNQLNNVQFVIVKNSFVVIERARAHIHIVIREEIAKIDSDDDEEMHDEKEEDTLAEEMNLFTCRHFIVVCTFR